MTAHVVFSDFDAAAPASTSARVTADVIRGHIGFDGLLMSDDLSMKALGGPMRERAEAVIRAGSDLALHCNGDLAEMQAAASGVPALAGVAAERFARATALLGRNDSFDRAASIAILGDVLAASA
jgi:beta-N-acetylhexosaminidase